MKTVDLFGFDPYFIFVILYNNYTVIPEDAYKKGSVVTIGNFDGLHKGHRTILEKGMNLARLNKMEFTVCTFEPHPVELFLKERPRLRLLTPESKYKIMAELGVSSVLAQHFDSGFASIEPEDFVKHVLVDGLNAKIVVVGSDFRFGKDRKGNIEVLKNEGQKYGFDVIGEELLLDEEIAVSSSRIRDLILRGEITAANSLLLRYHEVDGVVVHGQKHGRTMGFPTLNLESSELLLPKDGIYAAFTVLDDKRVLRSAVYIGLRPTLEFGRSFEVFLLHFDEEIYNKSVTVRFVERIRGDMKFKDESALQSQIRLDVEKIENILECHDEY
ncbi:MAG: bifunctional riboflavin kinase/FAD synthetase [Deltaproteobacteria bacterium]|nr:bifunctional riboflavin kinase/FAD synthetase [Deltaproteobacteria bacterium]